MDLTNITRTIGDTIAKIKNNNKLIEELNKKFNPTFVEIIENLQKTDPTLAKMLMCWYMETYCIDDKELDALVSKYQKKPRKVSNSSSKTYSSSGGCDAPFASSGGCNDADSGFLWRRSRSWGSSGGCGSSSSGGC